MLPTVKLVLGAAALAAGAVAGGAASRAEEPKIMGYLRAAQCMMPVELPSRGGDGLPPILVAPRADAARLDMATDPVIADDPPRVVRGYARVLRPDGSPGWVRRGRLRRWHVAASPGLRCLPARMSDGTLGFDYVHPG